MSATPQPIAHPVRSTVATVFVEVSKDDLLRLQALANTLDASERDFAERLRSAFHRGFSASYRVAGVSGPPSTCECGVEAPPSALDERPHVDSPQRTWPVTWRGLALLAAALVTIVIIVGSYAGHWAWTGLMQNGQVWDWMELLLLPVALGTFPLWLRFSGEMSPARRKCLGAAVLLFVAFVLAGYVVPLRWTGFRGHTLWNWLTLIILPVTITTATVWPKTGLRFRPVYRDTAELLVAAWVVTLIGGYGLGWGWTGYPGNTLWEWVQLLLAPIAISTFVVPELIKLAAGKAAEAAQAQHGSSQHSPALRDASQPGAADWRRHSPVG
jgi:hypothetical protein